MSELRRTSSEEKKDDLVITHTHSNLGVPVLNHGLESEAHTSERVEPDHGYDPTFVKKTMRKVDWRLVPILAALYSVSLIDRTNISLAAVAGMSKELQLTIENRYSIALLVFFPVYIAAEIPANIFIRKVSPAIWLSTAALAFGAVMIGMGFVKNYHTLALCRALIGFFEAAIFPGSAYLLSCWNIRREIQVRLSSFYMVSVFITGFASIWAYGLTQLQGRAGLAGWRWIFIVQGIVTCAVALVGYFVVPGFPDKAKFLTREEADFINTRIERDRGDAVPDPLNLKKTISYALSPKLWAFAINFGCSATGSYAFSYFLPLILRSFGYSVKDSQLLVAPPYVVAVVIALITAKLSDKTGYRSPFIVFNALLVVIGLCMIAYLPAANTHARYAGVFLGVTGVNSNIAATLGQAACSITGQSKRAYTSALQVMAGGIGGIVASTVFRSQDAPKYEMGIAVCLGAQVLVIVVQACLVTYFLAENAKARKGKKVIEDTPGFFYMI